MLMITSPDIVHSIRFLTGISVVAGTLLLLLALWIKNRNHQFLARILRGGLVSILRSHFAHILRDLLADILRDIGIAFYVAVIVTGIYELHVRQILDTEKLESVLSTVLRYNVPPSVWNEVSSHVLDGKAIRRKVMIDFEVKPDPDLPKGKAFLVMKYSYDLFSLNSNSTVVTVQHKFVSDYNNLARWEYGRITDSQNKMLGQLEPGEERNPFIKTIHLEPGYDFRRETINGGFIDANVAHVITQRREVINIPGIYPLGIPVLTEGTLDEPIRVSVTIPENLKIEPDVDPQWAEHNFSRSGKIGNTYRWTYTGVLLPGQSFDVMISKPL